MVAGNDTYVAMLKDILVQKKKVTEEILWVTLEQETTLAPELEDMDRFDALMEKKEPLLTKLEQLDTGFSDIYAKVQATLSGQKEAYKEEILAMQKLITEVTEISVKIQALEERNQSGCIECGACVEACPQHINIPEELKKVHKRWGKK